LLTYFNGQKIAVTNLYYLYKRIKYNIHLLCAFNKREGHKEKYLTPRGACVCVLYNRIGGQSTRSVPLLYWNRLRSGTGWLFSRFIIIITLTTAATLLVEYWLGFSIKMIKYSLDSVRINGYSTLLKMITVQCGNVHG